MFNQQRPGGFPPGAVPPAGPQPGMPQPGMSPQGMPPQGAPQGGPQGLQNMFGGMGGGGASQEAIANFIKAQGGAAPMAPGQIFGMKEAVAQTQAQPQQPGPMPGQPPPQQPQQPPRQQAKDPFYTLGLAELKTSSTAADSAFEQVGAKLGEIAASLPNTEAEARAGYSRSAGVALIFKNLYRMGQTAKADQFDQEDVISALQAALLYHDNATGSRASELRAWLSVLAPHLAQQNTQQLQEAFNAQRVFRALALWNRLAYAADAADQNMRRQILTLIAADVTGRAVLDMPGQASRILTVEEQNRRRAEHEQLQIARSMLLVDSLAITTIAARVWGKRQVATPTSVDETPAPSSFITPPPMPTPSPQG